MQVKIPLTIQVHNNLTFVIFHVTRPNYSWHEIALDWAGPEPLQSNQNPHCPTAGPAIERSRVGELLVCVARRSLWCLALFLPAAYEAYEASGLQGLQYRPRRCGVVVPLAPHCRDVAASRCWKCSAASSAGMALFASAGTAMDLLTHAAGTALHLPTHVAGTALDLPTHAAGTALDLLTHAAGTALDLPGHAAGTALWDPGRDWPKPQPARQLVLIRLWECEGNAAVWVVWEREAAWR